MSQASCCATTIGLGGLFGLVDAIAHPGGWLWITVRAVNGAVFVVAALLWLASFIRDRRARTSRAS